ncbi:MAG: hypothetical protein ABJZ55_04375 [Fuerstiella sp.]
MSLADAVADAVNYYRYRGASLSSIDSYAGGRCNGFHAGKRNAALSGLSSAGFAEKRGTLWYLQPDAFKSARGPACSPSFQDMDFAVAFAVLGTGDDCDLRTLIGTFDFVIRTLPSFDELYGGLNRLVAARLVKTKRGHFRSTELSSHLFLTAKRSAKKSIYDQLQAFTRLVLCPCCGATLKRVTWRVQLAEEEFSIAMKAYQAS